ncbi:MAG: hypothetical protein QOH21_1433 [Acidobacteriota bacterium]|jgi:hypothetical protein|nr:hypothetical protein [Acidobacteriota bacterium]
MRKRLTLIALVVVACSRPPVQDEVTIELAAEGGKATVTSQTTYELTPKNDAERERIDSARQAAISGSDEWSVRFARLTPDSEKVTFERTRGQLERVTHSARMPAAEVERLFSDTSISLQFVDGNDVRELRIYPGTSARATREQHRHFEEQLQSWSVEVAHYFTALHHFYDYLDEHPERARYVFAALLEEKGSDGAPPAMLDEERPLVEAVSDAMTTIAGRMDEQEERALTFSEEADLIYNPFPAQLTIVVPGEILAREGFAESKTAKTVTVEPVDLLTAIAGLEGRWVTPDPLAAALREETLTAAQMVEMPRESAASVSATEVAAAIREQLARPKSYLLRWRG